MSRPVRVLRVIARLNVGGPARHVTILDRGLQARGFQTMLAYGEVGAGEASLEMLVDEAAIASRRIAGLGRSVSPLSDLRAFARLLRLVFDVQPDVVHTHTAKAGTLGRLAAAVFNATRRRGRRCIVVHTFHGHVLHGYFSPLGSWLVRTIERALGLITDRVLVLSPRQQADIGARYKVVPAHRISIVPLGLELGPLLALEKRGDPAGGRLVFGFVGRMVPVKNLPMLLEAFAAVHRTLPAVRLLLVGDGDERPRLEAQAARQGLRQHVDFAGWRGDLAAVYREMDALVLTSVNEGTPVAVIEAMAAGLPVIATDVGGVADVVQHGATGLLVPSGDSARLAASMIDLATRSEERHRLGRAARESVRERYSSDRLVSDVAALYTGELERRRAR